MASLGPIKEGDIVEADVRGRVGFCLVTGKARGELQVRPISHGFTYRTVTSRQVVTHFRRTKNIRRVSTGQDAE